MKLDKESQRIPNPVPLSFRVDELPDDPGTVYDQGRKPLPNAHLRDIWADDLARTLWLAIKCRHLTNQYFKLDIVRVAASIRSTPPKTPLDLHYRIHEFTGEHWDDRSKVRAEDDFCNELFPYVLSVLVGGTLKLEWTEPPAKVTADAALVD